MSGGFVVRLHVKSRMNFQFQALSSSCCIRSSRKAAKWKRLVLWTVFYTQCKRKKEPHHSINVILMKEDGTNPPRRVTLTHYGESSADSKQTEKSSVYIKSMLKFS